MSVASTPVIVSQLEFNGLSRMKAVGERFAARPSGPSGRRRCNRARGPTPRAFFPRLLGGTTAARPPLPKLHRRRAATAVRHPLAALCS